MKTCFILLIGIFLAITASAQQVTENPTEESTRDANKPQFDNDFQNTLFPNPASGEVTVSVDGEVQSIAIYNAQGKPVGGWNMLSMANGRITLDVSPLPAGPYLVRIATPRGSVTRKLVVQRR